MLYLWVIVHISWWRMTFELILWDRCLLSKLPPGSLESLQTMLISFYVCKAFSLSDTSLCAEMYFICFKGEPSNLSDLRLHSKLCWWPALESGTTQPTLLRTGSGVRDNTHSSAEDRPGSQGPHSQLCWGTAWVSWTIWPTLLRNSLGVTDHSPMCDQPIEEWRSYLGKNWLIGQGVLIRDN